jgi:hypothetical protein
MAITFLKRGRAAQDAHEKAEKEAEVRAAQNKVRRFWVPKDGETTITFLDGKLNSDGLLDVVSYHEHRVFANGHWRNFFPCTAAEEPCPICEQDNQPTLVTVFSVLDHSKWKDRSGKVHRHERKLFVAKRDTVKRLQKLASKRGGLAGWRVSVSRLGDRSPEVGTDFDFVEKVNLKALAAELKLKPDDVRPFDYDEVIPYFSADELRDAGFGGHVVGQQDTRALRKQGKAQTTDDDDDDDDAFTSRSLSKKKAKPVEDDEDDDAFEDADGEEADDEDDAPPAKAKAKAKKKAKPVVVDDEEDEDEDEDEAPSAARAPWRSGKKKAVSVPDDEDDDASDDEDDEDEAPAPKAVKKAAKKVKKPVESDDEDDDL